MYYCVNEKEKQRNFEPDGGPNDPLTFAFKFSNQLVAHSLSAWLREQLFFSQLKNPMFSIHDFFNFNYQRTRPKRPSVS